MAIKHFGSAAIQIVADSATVRKKRNGLDEGECTFQLTGEPSLAGRVLQTTKRLGSRHPYQPHLFMEQQTLIYGANGATLQCSYAGVEYSWLEKPTYELILGMDESPIETHVDFKSDLAGTPSEPLNGALFLDPETGSISTDDATGVFDRFAPIVDGDLNPKAGVEAFLDMVATYRESYVSYYLPEAGGFGRISSSVPGPGFRGSTGKRNWLYVGFTYRRRGAPDGAPSEVMYEVTKEWKFSGRRGWDSDIY